MQPSTNRFFHPEEIHVLLLSQNKVEGAMLKNRTGNLWLFHVVIICFLLVCVVGNPKPVSAASSRFASPTGINTGDCTYTAPCNLQRAVQVTIEGQSVYAAAGIYQSTSDEVVFIDRSLRLYGGWDGISPNPVPDPVEYPTTLDGTIALVNHRVVNVALEPSEEVTISGFTIQNGNATSRVVDCFYSDSAGCGGGILVTGGSITIENNIIVDNVAATATDVSHTKGYGGGINLQNVVSGTITNNTIASNDALTAVTGAAGSIGIGGGIYITDYVETGVFSITGNEIYGNNATTTAFSGLGDGLYMLYGSGEISQNNFHDNNSNLSEQTSTFFATHSDLTISGNRFTNNSGIAALYLVDLYGSIGSNVIINPDAWDGIFMELNISPRSSYVSNNVIAQHSTADIYITGSVANPLVTSFHHNTLDGAPYGIYAYQYSTVEMTSNILSHHLTKAVHKAASGNTINAAYTLFHGNTTDGDFDSNTSAFTGDPLFVDATAGEYRLQAASAARDKATFGGYSYDFEGDPRPMGSGATPFDLGADEFWWKVRLPLVIKP
jgi:hypothetical protein